MEVANLIPGAGLIIAAAGKVLAKGANKRVEQCSRDLQESKDQIINKMIGEKLKIIVSIDDINRRSEEEIIAVFQLVKSLADFPNTVYILAFDYKDILCGANQSYSYEYKKADEEKIKKTVKSKMVNNSVETW